MKKLSSRERVLRTIAGESVDRIPIWPPIAWHPLLPEPEPGSWKAKPNYQEVVQVVRENCDFLVHLEIPQLVSREKAMKDAVLHAVYGGFFDRRFFLTPPERVDEEVETSRNGQKITTFTVHTPKGDLRSRVRVDPKIDTLWDIEPLIKEVDDVEKLLSVPHHFTEPDLASYFSDVEKLGDWGTPVCFVTTPLVMISHLMDFTKFLEWTITERALIDRMLEIACERVTERLQYALDHGVGPLFRFGGSEQATPPMMSKQGFDDFVINYEGRLWKMVRDAGQIVWVHCHGKIATVLDKWIQGGVQLLDPVEPPPQGDIEIGDAKRRAAAGPMTLIGNIEYSDLSQLPTDKIEAQVKQAVCDGGRKYFILGASEFPISEISNVTRDNLICFVEAGIKYGTFSRDEPCREI